MFVETCKVSCIFCILTLFLIHNFLNIENVQAETKKSETSNIESVAIIGTDVITNYDIYNRNKILNSSKESLLALVYEALMKLEAKKYSIIISKREINNAVQNFLYMNNIPLEYKEEFISQRFGNISILEEFFESELLSKKLFQIELQRKTFENSLNTETFLNSQIEILFIQTKEDLENLQIFSCENVKEFVEKNKIPYQEIDTAIQNLRKEIFDLVIHSSKGDVVRINSGGVAKICDIKELSTNLDKNFTISDYKEKLYKKYANIISIEK